MSIPLQPRQFAKVGEQRTVDPNAVVFSQVYLDQNKVKKIAKQGSKFDPVAADVNGRIIIQDGHHRTAADQMNKRRTTTVRIF